MSSQPKILVFASGGASGGGSGFELLVEQTLTDPPILNAHIVGVISNHENGGVRKIADRLDVPFRHWNGPYTADGYLQVVDPFDADYFMLSGWLKRVFGIQPYESSHSFRYGRIVNIHPGPLPRFGGDGMYGHHVHEAVLAAYRRGEVQQSAVTMHFVDPAENPGDKPEYDHGPIIAQVSVLIRPDDTADSLGARVNRFEHGWQAFVTDQVVHERIHLGPNNQVMFEGIPKEFFIRSE